jgi:hypothetical protein
MCLEMRLESNKTNHETPNTFLGEICMKSYMAEVDNVVQECKKLFWAHLEVGSMELVVAHGNL